ncbi:hypothetical protein VPHK460_0151 [Vibrio phage K460]
MKISFNLLDSVTSNLSRFINVIYVTESYNSKRGILGRV